MVPPSAELKMLRSLQKRLNERTRRYDDARGEEPLPPDRKAQIQRLADEQKRIEDLTRKLSEKAAQ